MKKRAVQSTPAPAPVFKYPKKAHIAHKVEMGVLFDIAYDTETTDLDKRFAEITQFGGVITDLAGNILHTIDLRAKVSPYTVISPYAWLVQRMRYEDLQKGDPRAIFMGKVGQFFAQTHDIGTAAFCEQFLSMCRTGYFDHPEGRREKYYSYPVLNDDGSTDWDYIRIHEGLKKFYFKSAATGQWVKRDIKAMVYGYNNINADDPWLWTSGHMAGFQNIFLTHLAQQGKMRLDALRVVEAAYVAGQKGLNAIQVKHSKNDVTGHDHVSFNQGSILEANTHLGSQAIGLKQGIVLPDGSHVDVNLLHGAYADAISLVSLMAFLRDRHPDIVRQMEMNTDWKAVIDRLTEVKDGFGNSPPLGYVDKSYPTIDGKMVSLIGTDQYRNAPKTAVVWNLSIDPAHYRYNGKAIADLLPFEWKQIIEESARNPNAPLKIIRAHKSPRLLDEDTAYAAGFNLDMDRNQINDRIRTIRRAKITDAVMCGLRLAFPRLSGPDRLILPQPEEDLFGSFSTLELFDKEAGEDVQVHHRVQNKVEEIAQKSRAHWIKIKSLWLSAIQFDESIFLHEEFKPEQVDVFLDKIKEINKKLKREGSVTLPTPDQAVSDKKSAMDYKIKIMFFARQYLVQGIIKDIGHHFWFEDKNKLRLDASDVMNWNSHQIDEALKSGNMRICHEDVHSTVLILDRLIEECGYAHILGDNITRQLESYKVLRRQGMPHHHGIGNRWNTVGQARRDLAKIRANEVMKEDIVALDDVIPGGWDLFVANHHENAGALEEYQRYLDSIDGPDLTPRQMRDVGINPHTQYPQHQIDYPVDIKQSYIVDVPDRYLEKPVIDPVSKRPLWILPLTHEFERAIQTKGISILFRAASTGRVWHVPHAQMVAAPPRGGVHEQFYKSTVKRYAQSGAEMPQAEQSVGVIGNGPYPLHFFREVDANAQTIHVPHVMFEGMVAPKLAGFRTQPQGMIVRADALEVKKGAVRLLEQNDGKLTGWEYGADISQVKFMDMASLRKLTNKQLAVYGFASMDEAVDYVSALFTAQQQNPQAKRSRVLAIQFARIAAHEAGDHKSNVMMYHKPGARIYAGIVPDVYPDVQP